MHTRAEEVVYKFFSRRALSKLGVTGLACNPSTRQAEAGRSGVEEQPSLHGILSQSRIPIQVNFQHPQTSLKEATEPGNLAQLLQQQNDLQNI